MSTGKVVAAVIGGLILLGAIGNALGGGSSRDPSDDAPARIGDLGSGGGRVVQIGQPVEVGSVTYTVLAVRTIPAGEYFQPDAGHQFVGVSIEARNTSDESEHVSSLLQFSLRDGTGQRFDQTIAERAGASLDGALPPGSTLRGEIAYEVPVGARGLQLVISDILAGAVTVQLT
jgi:uncharacterized protein DUF4352